MCVPQHFVLVMYFVCLSVCERYMGREVKEVWEASNNFKGYMDWVGN